MCFLAIHACYIELCGSQESLSYIAHIFSSIISSSMELSVALALNIKLELCKLVRSFFSNFLGREWQKKNW